MIFLASQDIALQNDDDVFDAAFGDDSSGPKKDRVATAPINTTEVQRRQRELVEEVCKIYFLCIITACTMGKNGDFASLMSPSPLLFAFVLLISGMILDIHLPCADAACGGAAGQGCRASQRTQHASC